MSDLKWAGFALGAAAAACGAIGAALASPAAAQTVPSTRAVAALSAAARTPRCDALPAGATLVTPALHACN